jgi:hypothetical protein
MHLSASQIEAEPVEVDLLYVFRFAQIAVPRPAVVFFEHS